MTTYPWSELKERRLMRKRLIETGILVPGPFLPPYCPGTGDPISGRIPFKEFKILKLDEAGKAAARKHIAEKVDPTLPFEPNYPFKE